MENIRALVEQCGLGTIEGEISPVTGGLMHKMYKVQTTTGTYAVKCLNPEIMGRPDALKNYSEAERLERILEENGIPVVAALSFDDCTLNSFDDKKMLPVNGRYYYVFQWQEGSITDFDAITGEQCYKAGEILGRIHAIDANNISPNEPVLSSVDFEALLDRAKSKDSVIAPQLEANLQLLKNAQNNLNEARKNLPAMRAISNDDMDPKNIMWHEGNPHVIDLECLGYSNPISSCLDLALQWAGTVNGKFNKDNLKAFFKGYLGAYDNGFRSYDELFGIAYTWIEWLEYNIKRALGMVSDDADEIRLGEVETENTIKRIKYLSSIEDDICLVLKNLPAPDTGNQ
ncbi:phosphotransferase enzyme family protein [Butyrivibrio sp. MB2005]|uniref:phosphotransferase enzyme family protein n=1 Tax=Butyrivibrio sp. MB2005 TaxID=1280678 RepID=UPI000479B3F5|nr:aminoglycoside phosphotransferase family protein [Butyrivibrio sp. MB2005]